MLGQQGRGGVRPDRPRLAVGLIEDDARHFALAQQGTHQYPPLAGHGEAAVARPKNHVWCPGCSVARAGAKPRALYERTPGRRLSLIHISEPTRLGMISYAVFCLKKQ